MQAAIRCRVSMLRGSQNIEVSNSHADNNGEIGINLH